MLREFFFFELRSYRRKPMLYLFFVLCFALMFLGVTNDGFTIGFGQDGVFVNSPFSIAIMVMTVSLIMGLFMAVAFGNAAALRDINSNFHHIVFSYPLKKRNYFWGRFLAAWVLTMIPLVGALLGIGVGAIMPFAPAEDIGPSMLMGYVQTFVLFILPNSFILTAIIFSLGLRFKSTSAGFVGALVFLVLYLVTVSLLFNVETGHWVNILDPLGLNASTQVTRYWTVFEINTRYMWSEPVLLLNRAGWFLAAFGLAWWQYRRFSFSMVSASPKQRKRRQKKEEVVPQLFRAVPVRAFQGTLRTRWAQFATMVRIDLRGILRSPAFWILMVLAVGNGLNALAQADGWYNNSSYPVTYIMINGLQSGMYLFTIALAIIYAGAVVWRERDVKVDAITDAMPFSNLGRISAKITAMLLVIFMVQVLGVLMGLFTQVTKGYTDIDLGHYATEVLGIHFLGFAWMIILSIFLHNLIHNKYLAYGATLVVLLVVQYGLPRLGVDAYLWRFGQVPDYTYTAFNGFGPFVSGMVAYSVYWTLLSLALWA
ncbi:MAG TPA: hypothetical protein DCP28_20645, partial [Cytophagales bacterium]|nr:hypothetical protein [Cytophagales bacterium]